MGESLFTRVKRVKAPIEATQNVDVCGKCKLKENGYVPSERHPSSRIVFVGEAPGKTEVEQKKPFVGASGKILRSAIEDLGITGYDVVNCLKCRVTDDKGNNRSPTPAELKRCKPLLDQELQGYDLHYLVGGTAISSILGDYSPTEFGGHCFVEQGKLYVPILHPAYLLRQHDKELEREWREDIAWGIRVLEGKVDKVKYTLVDTDDKVKELKDWIERYREGVVDIETTGLDILVDDLLCVGFRLNGRSFVYPLKFRPNWVEELNILIKELYVLIAHNGLFDVKMLRHKGINVRSDIRDTQVLAYLIGGKENEKQSLKLKALVKRLLGIRYKGLVRNMGKATEEEGYAYNAEDLEYTDALFEYLWAHLPNDSLRRSYSLFLGNAEYPIIEMASHGFKVSKETLIDVKTELDNTIEEIKEGLTASFGDVNWTSPAQLGPVLKNAGVDTGKTTKTGRMQVRADDLELMSNEGLEGKAKFLVDSLVELKTLAKLNGTYVTGLQDKISSDWRVRADYSMTTTDTGRTSCRNPNIQSIPRASRIRKMFVAPPGYKLVVGDYSQIELRVASIIYNIPKMRQAFLEGKDIHRLTASLVSGKAEQDVTKEERQSAKSVNFGFIFGASHIGFMELAAKDYGVIVDEGQALDFRRKFFDAYDLKGGHDKMIEFVRVHKYAETLFGRRRYLPDIDSSDLGLRGHAERQGLNTPVQGTASDINLLSMYLIWKQKEDEKVDAHFVATVHDSFLSEVYIPHLEKFLKFVDAAQIEVAKIVQQFTEVEIPKFDIELKIVDAWGE